MNIITTKSTSLLSLSLLCALFAVSALPSMAADTYWNGSVDDKWGTADNWGAGLPTASVYANFGYPYSTPITLSVDDIFKVYAFSISGSRTADLTFTGDGALEIYRTSDIVVTNGGACRLTFDVNVTNASSHAQTILGDNTFLKDLYIGSSYDFNIGSSGGNPAAVLLGDNANLTARSLSIYADSSLTMVGSAALNLMGDSTLNVYKNKSALNLSDDAVLNGCHMKVYDGASATISDNVQVNLLKDLIVYPGGSLAISGNPVINLRKLVLPFSYAEGTDEEWTMGGGEVRAMVSNENYRLEMPYTNATKTVSGTGTFCMYKIAFDSASNLVFRLNGPNVYLCSGYISSSSVGHCRARFEIGGGSTIGMWGADAVFDRWTNRVVGAATVDTTDYADKTTPRTLTLSKYFDCNGELTVKGVGTCALGSPEQANLDLVGTESSTITCANGYALGDIALTDSAAMTVTEYMGHKNEESYRNVKSLTLDEDSTFDVNRYVILSGDATLSGNAKGVVRNGNGEDNPIFSCVNLSLSDDASLSVTGTIAATSLAMSGNAHLAFTAGTAFEAGAAFGAGNWTMEITIPSGYEAGIRPVVKGANFGGDFAEHVTLLGDTTGWSARTIDGNLVLYKESQPSGIEWIGKSTTSDNWSDEANWNDGNVPTADDIVAFGGLDRPTPYNDTVGTVSGLVFRASAGPFVLSGSGNLVLTASSGGRGSTSVANAAIVSHSNFDQTIESFVNFNGKHAGMISNGGGALMLMGGFTATGDWNYFVAGGDIRVGGTCSVGIFSFKTSTTGTPSCLRVLSGATFTCRNQYFRALVNSTSYLGHFVVEDDGTLVIQNGDCAFLYGGLENVIDGTLIIKGTEGGEIGRLVGGPSEQYYAGAGVIYADSARSASDEAAVSHYINFGGTLKLYMNGDWNTASYALEKTSVVQNPNYPTRFRMKDGTTLGATADWTYGPAADAYNVIANALTPDARKSIMVGTVTVNTQNPTNDIAHTITFVDPLDASAANLVKVGAGSLVFNPTNSCPSQVSNLTVNAGTVLFKGDSSPTVGGVVANAGTVRFDVGPALGDMTISNGATASFTAAPTLSGALTIASTDANFCVDGVAATAAWEPLAAAADIVGPDSETKWKTADGMRRFKIVSEVAGKVLYGAQASGFTVILR